MLADPPKEKHPVLEAALIAFFTAIATKTVELIFKKLDKKKEEEDEEEENLEEEEEEEPTDV